MAMYGMNTDATGAHILLSLSPPITPIRAPALATSNRTFVGPLASTPV